VVPTAAVIAGDLPVATGTVVTVKVAVVWPAATVTEAPTVATAVLFEVVETTMPPVGAAGVIVTVAVDEFPPTTDVGFNVRPVTAGALTSRTAVLVVPGMEAVMVALVLVETPTVVIVQLPTVWPAAIVTDAGTVAEGSLEERVTITPPAGAGVAI